MGEQRYQKSDTSTGAALTVDLDTTVEPVDLVEIFVKSSGAATFEIFGSSDGTNWHNTDSLAVTSPDFEKTAGFMNAYRFIRVATTAVADNEIEIVGNKA